MKTLAAVLLVGTSSVAQADGLTARFGMTFSPYADQTVPESFHEVGPLVAVGDRLGRFVGEVEWAWLSMFDPLASPSGVHRLGVTLRADLWHDPSWEYSTHAKALYVEGGAAERFGQWLVQPTEMVPVTSPQPELHLGAGFEMDNETHPHRNGWQIGLRFAVAHGDQLEEVACRTASNTGCPTGNRLAVTSGTERSFFIEWMYLIGN
jgi:hypothetical protein